MSTHPNAATSGGCVLCGGPCQEPMHLDPIPDHYPFMNADAIAATQPEHGPPAPDQRTGRARRRGEDRMKQTETHERKVEDR